MREKIILIGGGGHCKSFIDVIEQEGKYQIAGIVDVREKIHQKILGYEIVGTDKDLPLMAKQYSSFLITIADIFFKQQSSIINHQSQCFSYYSS